MTIHQFSKSAKNTFNPLHQAGIQYEGAIKCDKLQAYFPSSDDVPLPSGELSRLVHEAGSGENPLYLMRESKVPGVMLGSTR